jgi:hypothetical protein
MFDSDSVVDKREYYVCRRENGNCQEPKFEPRQTDEEQVWMLIPPGCPDSLDPEIAFMVERASEFAAVFLCESGIKRRRLH